MWCAHNEPVAPNLHLTAPQGKAAIKYIAGQQLPSWNKTVLDQYGMHCSMFPDPALYPHQLRQLASGGITLQGFKELLTCETDPEWKRLLR